MRSPRAFTPSHASPRLLEHRTGERTELWTEAVGAPPPVYGERWAERDGRLFRSFEPARSKLSAALVRGWEGPIPRVGEAWLYLGAASGTTASHVADLVGPSGSVYAVERSIRPFLRLLSLAERWPNLDPVLADATDPGSYLDLVPPVDGVYGDVAQAAQVELFLANARWFLRGPRTKLLLALKTASMGRDASPVQHLRAAEEELSAGVDLAPSVRLEPFHRGHYLVGGIASADLFPGRERPSATPRPERSRGRRGR